MDRKWDKKHSTRINAARSNQHDNNASPNPNFTYIHTLFGIRHLALYCCILSKFVLQHQAKSERSTQKKNENKYPHETKAFFDEIHFFPFTILQPLCTESAHRIEFWEPKSG